jgi:transcriptional regulator with XRE-family HTH domain
MTRLVQATGKSKNTVLRYLAGERDIRVAELKKFAGALELSLGDIFAEADRRVD